MAVRRAFFFHFQRMLTINHPLVQIADATTSANALNTSRLARQMPNSHVSVSLFAVFLSDACAVVLQCGGHSHMHELLLTTPSLSLLHSVQKVALERLVLQQARAKVPR